MEQKRRFRVGVSKEIKGKSDKTVPDCLHVCRVFWCNPFFSPVQLDKKQLTLTHIKTKQ